MNYFLMINFASSESSGDHYDSVIRRSESAIKKLTDDSNPKSLYLNNNTSLFLGGDIDKNNFYHEDNNFCLLTCNKPYTHFGNCISNAQAFLELYHKKENIFREIVPPFGVVFGTKKDAVVYAAVDSYGLKHMYYSEIDNFVAVSSSALLISKIIRSTLNEEGLAVLSKVGHLLGDLTLFRNVRKVPEACVCKIKNAQIEFSSYSKSLLKQEVSSEQDCLQSGKRIIRACMESCLNAHPDAAIQLSGGIDSRLLISAIEPRNRSRLTAITIAEPVSDLQSAISISKICSMSHNIIDLSPLRNLAKEDTYGFVKEASVQCDFTMNPFSRAVLHWVEKKLGYMPRLSGENGEYARGFYYPGQVDRSSFTRQMIERLARWRILVNDLVDKNIFKPDYQQFILDVTFSNIEKIFYGHSGNWLDRTDVFYLLGRMQHLKGSEFSSFAINRPLLMPFFDQRFISWATSIPPKEKRNNRLVAKLIHEFEPILSSLSLDTGIPPDCFFKRGLTPKMLRASFYIKKASAVLARKLFCQNAIAVGAEPIVNIILQNLHINNCFPRLQELPFINKDYLAQMSKSNKLNYSTIGLLLNLEWILDFLEG